MSASSRRCACGHWDWKHDLREGRCRGRNFSKAARDPIERVTKPDVPEESQALLLQALLEVPRMSIGCKCRKFAPEGEREGKERDE